MTDEPGSGSIISEVGERLDDIFGEDEGENAPIESTPSETSDESQLDELRGLLFTTEGELSHENINAVDNEVKQLEEYYRDDTQILALLKIMSLVTRYMKLKKADIHPETDVLLNSVFRCLEKVIENNALSTYEKRALIEEEIHKFNNFKSKIISVSGPSGKESTQPIEEHTAEESEPMTSSEQSLETVSPGKFFTALDDLRSFLMQELTALKGRVEELKGASTSSGHAGGPINEEINVLKDRMNDLKDFSADFKNLGDYVREEFASQKSRIDDLKNLSNDLDIVRSRLADEFVHVKDQVNELKGELSRLRDDLNKVYSELENIKGSLSHVRTESIPDKSSRDEDGIEETEESPDDSESSLDRDLLEPDFITEDSDPIDEFQEGSNDGETEVEEEKPEEGEQELFVLTPGENESDQEFSASGSYFFFQMGGKKYAMGEESVIKASKAGRRLLKKASDKGGLTMKDCSRMFSDVKRGVEKPWGYLSSKDLEKTTFHLLTDDRIDGLLDTKGGGMLFLGSGEKRSLLFTDQIAKKESVTDEDKVEVSNGSEYVCGSIQKEGDESQEYLILDADRLCKRLRVSIPAPFTKV